METQYLTSYIYGYDNYCEPKEEEPDIDYIIDDILNDIKDMQDDEEGSDN